MTASTPAAAAASASSTEPTWISTFTPLRCASSTNGAAGPQKRTQRHPRLHRRVDLFRDERAVFVGRIRVLECGDDEIDAERSVGQLSNTIDPAPDLIGRQAAAAENAAAAGARDGLDELRPAETAKPAEKIGCSIPSSRQMGVLSTRRFFRILHRTRTRREGEAMSQLDDLLGGLLGSQGGAGSPSVAAGGQGGAAGSGAASLIPMLLPVLASLLAGGGLNKILDSLKSPGRAVAGGLVGQPRRQ